MNPFDEIAVEEAIRLKEKGVATEVVVVSIGVKQAQETLRNALAMGADRAILIEATDNVHTDIEPLAVGRSPLQEGLYEDWDRMIDTNMKGLLYVTREIVPLFIANKKGHIINIGSLAGHEYYGGGNVYCGTKHAVKAITRSMRIDLLKEGIKVSAVSPGAVETEFSVVRYKGNKEMADKTYDGFEPLKAEDVAESIYFIANQPKHVNIEEILVLPTAQASTSIIFKQ